MNNLGNLLTKVLIRASDAIFLILGYVCLAIGVFLIYIPAGWITVGLCFLALAFFVAKKQAMGGGS